MISKVSLGSFKCLNELLLPLTHTDRFKLYRGTSIDYIIPKNRWEITKILNCDFPWTIPYVGANNAMREILENRIDVEIKRIYENTGFPRKPDTVYFECMDGFTWPADLFYVKLNSTTINKELKYHIKDVK